MAPRLPRMYWGKVVYATPGSGKTYVARKYDDVVDSDDLIVQSIQELYEWFVFSPYISDPRMAINQFFRYIHFHRRKMNEIYDRTIAKIRAHCNNDDVVLLGTKDLLHLADYAFIQQDESLVRSGFNQDREIDQLESSFMGEICVIYEYLDNSLQRLCAGKLESYDAQYVNVTDIL